ncbi:MAG: DUF998 domain-containing protein [Gammaproteobacteria bacterium]|nr:DUF998 domain-containing protein [Gammaproteobacteria bacterium]MDH4253219.1 DUF998 domain-containing protein [Gammaproteobacteria bacterium]MDH5309002.1 DUF998 domain-containing protein [Gammaproteobacteria bacterium]
MRDTNTAKTAIRVLVLASLAAIFAGPWYTEPGYDWIAHSVSELAGQHTKNAWIMRGGLLALGAASIAGFLAFRPGFNVLFAGFGLFIALSALFPHKPFVTDRPYSELLDQVHSICASVAGLCAVLGFVFKARVAEARAAMLSYALIAAAYTLVPMLMFSLPAWQGLFQRALFLSFSIWVLADGLPRRRDA